MKPACPGIIIEVQGVAPSGGPTSGLTGGLRAGGRLEDPPGDVAGRELCKESSTNELSPLKSLTLP